MIPPVRYTPLPRYLLHAVPKKKSIDTVCRRMPRCRWCDAIRFVCFYIQYGLCM